MIKKLMLAALCMHLILSMVFPCALAEDKELLKWPEDENMPRAYMDGLIAVDDSLLMFMRGSDGRSAGADLYRWAPGMEDAEKLAEGLFVSSWCASEQEMLDTVANCEAEYGVKMDPSHMITGTFTDGKRLMAYNVVSGAVFEVKAEGGKATYEDILTIKDTSFLFHQEGEDRWLTDCRNVILADNRLIFLVWDYDTTHDFTRLISVDLTTGETVVSKQENVKRAVLGKDGQLLLVIRDDMNAYDSKTNTWAKPTLALWDPAADAVTEIGQLDAEDSNIAVTYSQTLDALVYLENCRVMAVREDQAAKQVGYVPCNWASRISTVGDSVAIEYAQGNCAVLLRTVSWDYNENDRLLVSGGYLDEGGRLFTSRYPQVPLYGVDYNSGLEGLSQAMSAGEKAPDVIELHIAYTQFDTLMRKGYCEDLSGNANITAYTDRLYPCFREAVSKDGKLFAVPLTAFSYDAWYVANGVMEEMKLTFDDIPKNLIDLCAFVTRWNDEWVDEFPQFAPMEYTENYKATILRYMMEGYMGSCQAQGKEVRFDTPEFQAMLAALDAMRVDKLEKGVARENEDEVGYRQGLLMHGYSLVGAFAMTNEYRTFLPITLTADTPFKTGVEMVALFVNPKSSHKEMAYNYIQCMIEALNDNARCTMLADETEPVRNLYYDQMIKSEEAWLATLEKKLAEADEADKKELESSIEVEKKWLASAEENYYYQISPKQLAFFQEEIAPAMYVRKPTFLRGADSENEELQTLIDRYLAGQLKTDQFIKAIDSKLQMMQMEDW